MVMVNEILTKMEFAKQMKFNRNIGEDFSVCKLCVMHTGLRPWRHQAKNSSNFEIVSIKSVLFSLSVESNIYFSL